MELKRIVTEIKEQINSEEVKSKIASDLGINLKSNTCRCFIITHNCITI